MKVILNNTEITIFKGATLNDLVLHYSKRSYKMLKNNKLCIYDRFGNLTEPDGPVYEGQVFFLKRAE
jgi:glycogen synthase